MQTMEGETFYQSTTKLENIRKTERVGPSDERERNTLDTMKCMKYFHKDTVAGGLGLLAWGFTLGLAPRFVYEQHEYFIIFSK